jgi:hypothetical protein
MVLKRKIKVMLYSIPLIIRPPLLYKNNLIGGVVSLARANLVFFYYLSASEIWPFGGRGIVRRGTTL